MPDVFISYRRGDGPWARLLAQALDDYGFAVFFDVRSMDYGDNFPTEIEEALRSCRVVLVVIGPEWIKRKNIRRLADEKDWVRREISMALERRSIRVVPLVVGPDAKLPKVPVEADLPADLRAMLSKNHCPVRYEKLEEDCQDLGQRLEGWLSGQVGSNRLRNAMPQALPYLCNRIPQEEDFTEQWGKVSSQAKHTPGVCLLHGYKWEAHDGFIERLQYSGALEKIFNVPKTGVGIYRLDINWEKVKAGDCIAALRNGINRCVLQRPSASLEDLTHYLCALPQPALWVLQVTGTEYRACGPNLISNLVQAWNEILLAPATVPAMQIRLPHPLLLWINFCYDDPSQELSRIDDDRVMTLTKLSPVTDGDIQRWISHKEVKRYFAGREVRLLDLTKDESRCCEKGKMHMHRFAEAVREMFADGSLEEGHVCTPKTSRISLRMAG